MVSGASMLYYCGLLLWQWGLLLWGLLLWLGVLGLLGSQLLGHAPLQRCDII